MISVIHQRFATVQFLVIIMTMMQYPACVKAFTTFIGTSRSISIDTRLSPQFSNPLYMSSSSSSESVTSSGSDPSSSTGSNNSEEDDNIALQVENVLKKEYPSFHSLLSQNDNIWKILGELTTDFTLFVPNQDAFTNLGKKKLQQLRDVRNLETTQKMGLYHVVAEEAVTPAQLRTEDWTVPKPTDGSPRPITIMSVRTMAGKVPVGRTKVGGFLGWGTQERGEDVIIGPTSKIVKSIKITGRTASGSTSGTCIIHEMDAFVSPEILWRYCDQLTIPGLS